MSSQGLNLAWSWSLGVLACYHFGHFGQHLERFLENSFKECVQIISNGTWVKTLLFVTREPCIHMICVHVQIQITCIQEHNMFIGIMATSFDLIIDMLVQIYWGHTALHRLRKSFHWTKSSWLKLLGRFPFLFLVLFRFFWMSSLLSSAFTLSRSQGKKFWGFVDDWSQLKVFEDSRRPQLRLSPW